MTDISTIGPKEDATYISTCMVSASLSCFLRVKWALLRPYLPLWIIEGNFYADHNVGLCSE